MNIFFLLVHGVSAALLWGALTHQALAVAWPAPRSGTGFWASLRSVHSERYPRAVIFLFCSTLVLGALLYPEFRIVVRAGYLDAHKPWATGFFEIKEHAAAIGFATLPLYAAAWRDPSAKGARLVATLFLAAIVWFNFIVGHVVNNIRGL